MIVRTHQTRDSVGSSYGSNLVRLGEYSARMDLVVSHWTLTGTHSGGAYYDVPPSGERVTINGTAILRLRDGQVVEHWGGPHCMHGIGLARVVGPGPHTATGADATLAAPHP